MRGPGCLLLLLIIGMICVELWVFLLIVTEAEDVILPLLAIIGLSWSGWRIIAYHIKLLPAAFLTGDAGRRLVGLIAGAMLIFPGFISGALALPLLLPPVQRLFGRLGNAIAGGLMRHVMGRMKPGGFPGGFPGGPFPGMQQRSGPLRPDDSVRTPPKIIDTTVERDDDPKP